jgi:ABC-type sulfate transport system permease subunit
MGEFGAVSVVSGHIRGETNTLPLHVEICSSNQVFKISVKRAKKASSEDTAKAALKVYSLYNIKWGLIYGVILCNARAMGEFGAVSVVSGHIRGENLDVALTKFLKSVLKELRRQAVRTRQRLR